MIIPSSKPLEVFFQQSLSDLLVTTLHLPGSTRIIINWCRCQVAERFAAAHEVSGTFERCVHLLQVPRDADRFQWDGALHQTVIALDLVWDNWVAGRYSNLDEPVPLQGSSQGLGDKEGVISFK